MYMTNKENIYKGLLLLKKIKIVKYKTGQVFFCILHLGD